MTSLESTSCALAEEIEALFREARRRRRRRRWLATAATAAVLLTSGGILLTSADPGGGGGGRSPTRASPLSAAPVAGSQPSHHAYRLPSDTRIEARISTEAGFGGSFHAELTRAGPCAWFGSYSVIWPPGYEVRFDPTELLDPRGKVVLHEGDAVSAAGEIVGIASWPSASRCYLGGDLIAIKNPLFTGKRAYFP